jgi:hypothetical protein
MPLINQGDLYNRSAIGGEQGSDFCLAAIVDYTASLASPYKLTLLSTVFKLPVIKDSTIEDKTEVKEAESESGLVAKSMGKRTSSFKVTVMQQDKATLEFMNKTVYGKYLTIVKEMSIEQAGGKNNYAIIPFAKAIPTMSVKKPGNSMEWEFAPETGVGNVEMSLVSFAGTGAFVTALTCSLFTFSAATPVHFYEQ